MPIKLKSLQKTALESAGSSFNFADLKLDFKLNARTPSRPTNATANKYDISLSFDTVAIRTSIFNIFNTRPGQKILNPVFGLDLGRFVGEQMTDETAQEIGELILNELPIWEPRITVQDVSIEGDTKQNQYTVNFQINIPKLGDELNNIKGILDTKGFRYI